MTVKSSIQYNDLLTDNITVAQQLSSTQMEPMDILRNFMWLWVVIAVIFLSLVICLVFILINKCISKDAEHGNSQLHIGPEFYAQSNNYHPKSLEEDLPPLPPRTQFLTAEAQSYENLADGPDYVKVEDEVILPPPPYQFPDPAAVCQPTLSGQQSTCSLDNASTEDYDDIGEDNPGLDEEDYDDVG